MSKKSKGASEASEVTQAQPEAKGLGSDQNQAIETGQGAAASAAHLAQAPTLAGHPIEDSSAPNAGDSTATPQSEQAQVGGEPIAPPPGLALTSALVDAGYREVALPSGPISYTPPDDLCIEGADDIGPGEDAILCNGPGTPELAIAYEVLIDAPPELIEKIATERPDVRRLHGVRQVGPTKWSVVVETAKTVEKLEISL